MRSPVQSFPVNVHDIYDDARASMKSPRRPRSSTAWGLTAVAALLGAGLGWYIAAAPAGGPAVERVAVDSQGDITVAPATAAGDEAATGFLGPNSLGAAVAQPLDANAWPITLHRAGDGQFYADLSLDGHIVNGRIDPERARSTLRAADLPDHAMRGGLDWPVRDVVLEHLRLPSASFLVNDDPATESVIGSDLLQRFFTIEEGVDRLRLVPRAG